MRALVSISLCASAIPRIGLAFVLPSSGPGSAFSPSSSSGWYGAAVEEAVCSFPQANVRRCAISTAWMGPTSQGFGDSSEWLSDDCQSVMPGAPAGAR